MKKIKYLLFILLLIPNIIFGKMNYDDALKFASTYTSSLNDSYDKFFISGKDKFISINEFDVASSNGLSYLSSNGLDYWSNSVDANNAYAIEYDYSIHSKSSTEHIRIAEYTKSEVIVTSGLGTNNDPWILDSTIKKIIINSDNDAIGQINNGTFLTSSETINTEINNLNQYFQVNTGTTMCSNGGRITITDRTKVQVINSNKKDIMCTVKYEYRTMTVTYDANGGSVSTTSGIQRYNSTYANLPTPTRENYDFVGWYTESADGAGQKITSDTIVNRIDNHTLYAHWKLRILFHYSGNFKIDSLDSSTVYNNADFVPTSTEWKVYLLTSGELTSYTNSKIDMFLVAGGTSGSSERCGGFYDRTYGMGWWYYCTEGTNGNGGQCITKSSINLTSTQSYQVVVGSKDNDSSAFGFTAKTGKGCNLYEFGKTSGTGIKYGSSLNIIPNSGNGGTAGKCDGTSCVHNDTSGSSGIVILKSGSSGDIIINGNNIANYTGGYDIVENDGTNWTIKITSGGIFTANSDIAIDAFLVGGGQYGGQGKTTTWEDKSFGTGTHCNGVGGSAGSGGSCTTLSRFTVSKGVAYTFKIGDAGLNLGNNGGSTIAFGSSASGGGTGGACNSYPFGESKFGVYGVTGGGNLPSTGNGGQAGSGSGEGTKSINGCWHSDGTMGADGTIFIRNAR